MVRSFRTYAGQTLVHVSLHHTDISGWALTPYAALTLQEQITNLLRMLGRLPMPDGVKLVTDYAEDSDLQPVLVHELTQFLLFLSTLCPVHAAHQSLQSTPIPTLLQVHLHVLVLLIETWVLCCGHIARRADLRVQTTDCGLKLLDLVPVDPFSFSIVHFESVVSL